MIEPPRSSDALPATVAANARVYPPPCARGPLPALARMVAAGKALRLAGGPLAFSACEIAIRELAGVTRTAASLAEISSWAARQDGAIGTRVDRLLDDLSRPR